MKKFFSLLLVVAVIFSLCACGRKTSSADTEIPTDSEALDFSNSVTIVSNPTPVPAAQITVAPAATPASATPVPSSTPVTAVATPTPTIVIVNTTTSSNPITKSPINDVCQAGGSVSFTASATNYSNVCWKIKLPSSKTNPDSSNIFNASDAPLHFAGLSVSGEYSTTLTLSNVPSEMDGCLIQCVFDNTYYTNNAILTVVGEIITDPVKAMAESCAIQFASIAGTSYTTSAVQNYVSASDGSATFDISFVSSSYTVIGSFKATSTYFVPVSAVVYQAADYIGQKTIDSDHTNQFNNILLNPGSIVL